jgi:hypothetical protein
VVMDSFPPPFLAPLRLGGSPLGVSAHAYGKGG